MQFPQSRQHILLYLTLAMTVLPIGCSFRAAKDSADETSEAVVDHSVGYDEVSRSVISKSCTTCHDTQRPTLMDFQSVNNAADAIRQEVFGDRRMPPNTILPADQRAILKKWLDEGAPQIAPATPVTAPSNGPTKGRVTWSMVKAKVADVSCAGCHYPKNPAGLTDLTDENVFQSEIASILDATLVETVTPMPPLPATLTNGQKRLLSEWVIDGQSSDTPPSPGPGPSASPSPLPSASPLPNPSSVPPETKPITFAVIPSTGQNPDIRFDIGYTAGTHHGDATGAIGSATASLAPLHIVSGKITVPISSMATSNVQRDCHMREALGINYAVSKYPGSQVCDSSDQLPASGPDSIAFPNIELDLQDFSAQTVRLGPGAAVDVTIPSVLSIHGVVKNQPIPVHIADDARSGVITVTGTFNVSLKDYGIVVRKILFISVSDRATVHLNFMLQPVSH